MILHEVLWNGLKALIFLSEPWQDVVGVAVVNLIFLFEDGSELIQMNCIFLKIFRQLKNFCHVVEMFFLSDNTWMGMSIVKKE